MNTNPKRPTALFAAAVMLASTPLLAPASATATADTAASARLKCRATVSDKTPKQYTDVFVRVKTAPRAKAKAVAHYKTTKTTKRDRANRKGKARMKFYISGATPGRKVDVKVTVTKKRRTNTCWTSFKPHR